MFWRCWSSNWEACKTTAPVIYTWAYSTYMIRHESLSWWREQSLYVRDAVKQSMMLWCKCFEVILWEPWRKAYTRYWSAVPYLTRGDRECMAANQAVIVTSVQDVDCRCTYNIRLSSEKHVAQSDFWVSASFEWLAPSLSASLYRPLTQRVLGTIHFGGITNIWSASTWGAPVGCSRTLCTVAQVVRRMFACKAVTGLATFSTRIVICIVLFRRASTLE